ncbi:slit -like protein [Brachionus plicatilis]|uniref:Slit-like protein n=1 Tax=Brachionus plicatilis TaxID=10195 RepID=A0A3M7QG64_BRAPC|nr:slit -like protein [Brachionus plicatilis]
MNMHIFLVFFLWCTAEATLNQFSTRYKCVSNDKSLSCSDTSESTLDLSLIDQSIDHLDMSNTRIQKIKFTPKPLNIISLNLSNTLLSELGESYFASMPHLKRLDLSLNKLKRVDKAAFKGTLLEHLNLSSTDYQFTHELCDLELLRTLDVSYLDLIKLECLNSIHLASLFAKNSLNFESSFKNWLPSLPALKFIDLSSSNIENLEPVYFQNLSLTHFIFGNNSQINHTSLRTFLTNSSILSSLKCLVLSDNKLNESTFDLNKIVAEHNSSLKLQMLDIGNNWYSGDLNEFLFSQQNLVNLEYFVGAGNKFQVCNKKLSQLSVVKLKYLDVSHNELMGSSCLYSLKDLKSLTFVDLSHNFLNSSNDETELRQIFVQAKNLSSINFSFNLFSTFVIRFSLNHTRIKSIDFSHNLLTRFRFESFDAKADPDLEDKFYEKDDADQFDVMVESPLKVESDQRYIFADSINLSHNKFQVVNIHHQFQSVENILYLNMSHNPVMFANGLSDEAVLFSNMKVPSDKLKKILCIDRLDFGNNVMNKIPNLMHSCISKINLENNHLDKMQRLIVSNFTIYFLDEVNLKNNNIESISVGLSGQKYMSDFYPSKNSPVDYFYGKVNKSLVNHTSLDIRGNQHFKCDCAFFKTIHEYVYLNFLVDCRLKAEVIQNCTFVARPDVTKTKQLNSRLRFSFVLTCLLLIAISFSLIVFMCSDMCKNFTYLDQVRAIARQKIDQFRKDHKSENIDVQYSKLVDEATVSTIEINA